MKIAAFVPLSENYMGDFKKLEASLRKFHTEEELPLIRVDNTLKDPQFWYRAKPIIASDLIKQYDTLIGLDADQIILGSLADIINDPEPYDAGVVLNDPTYPIQIWDIRWPYFNNGLVVLKSKEFIAHWLKLCMSPHFPNYQYREQDFLNMLCSDYFNYKIKPLEREKIYGEWGKPFWTKSYMKDGKVFVKMDDMERQLCVYHSGGGNTPDKGNYRIRFPEEVSDYIDKLIK